MDAIQTDRILTFSKSKMEANKGKKHAGGRPKKYATDKERLEARKEQLKTNQAKYRK